MIMKKDKSQKNNHFGKFLKETLFQNLLDVLKIWIGMDLVQQK